MEAGPVFHHQPPWETTPSTFSNDIRFYQWKQDTGYKVKFLHSKDYEAEFGTIRDFVCCDGLVLAPTDTKLYLFNPATRDSITLPDSDRNNLCLGGDSLCYCVGLGLDPRTGNYKVVQAFYRSTDEDDDDDDDDTKKIYHMGMEVLTIAAAGNNGGWREIAVDPPYPAASPQTSLSLKGFMFWHIDTDHSEQEAPWGFLHFNLADETFGVTQMPDSLHPSAVADESFHLDVVHDELCVTARISDGVVTIWTLRIEEDQRWERRFTLNLSDIFHPLAFLSGGGIMMRKGHFIYSCELAGPSLTIECMMDCVDYDIWEDPFCFDISPYVESLVQITI